MKIVMYSMLKLIHHQITQDNENVYDFLNATLAMIRDKDIFINLRGLPISVFVADL